MDSGYTNGYIQRTGNGSYEGSVVIDGVTLPEITAVYFKQGEESYLWLRRKKVLEYDSGSQSYKERDAEPRWEAYLKKQMDGETVAYKGEFMFLRFRFSIVGIWDGVLGRDRQRLNLFVERMPMSEQTVINNNNERKLDGHGR
jgi:hypothetical protein